MSTIKDDGREQVYLERIAISETLDALGGADGYIFHATTFETEIHEGCPMIAQDGPTVLVPPLVTIRTTLLIGASYANIWSCSLYPARRSSRTMEAPREP